MTIKSCPPTPMNLRFLPLLLALSAISAVAQELSNFPYRIIQSRKVDFGDHFVFLNRVAPPAVPPLPASVATPAQPEFSAEVTETLANLESKKSELLFLFATVFDRDVTELHWCAGGREYRALSNIDFNYFTVLGQIETENTVYGLMLAIGNESSEALDSELGPLVSRLSNARSEYILIDGKEQDVPDASLAGLDALHVYFDAHRQKLIDAYVKREADRVAEEQWIRDHPPVPKDTVINFWPGATTIFIDSPAKGGK